MTRARWLNLIGAGIGIAGLVFVAVRVGRDRAEIADVLESADVGWLVASLVSGLCATLLLGINWLHIIRRTGASAPWRRGLQWFMVGQLGKYVPGGIWPIVGQAELAHRAATPRSVAYSSTALSMMATLLGAVAVGASTGLISPAGSRLIPVVLAIGLIAVAIVLASERTRAVVHAVGDRFTTRALRLPDARTCAETVARYLPVWLLFSGINICVLHSLAGGIETSLAITMISATCVAWAAGFVIIGLPGGLGVREAVFISMMTAPLGATAAVSVAVASRAVWIAVDVLSAVVSIVVSRSAPPVEPDGSQAPGSYASP